MKRMVIAAVGTALLASLSLSACSTNSGNNIELTVWTSQEDQKNQDAWLQTMQAWFEEDHPELNITWHNSVVPPDSAVDTVGQDPAAAADVYQLGQGARRSVLWPALRAQHLVRLLRQIQT